jgi:hypothetical protein
VRLGERTAAPQASQIGYRHRPWNLPESLDELVLPSLRIISLTPIIRLGFGAFLGVPRRVESAVRKLPAGQGCVSTSMDVVTATRHPPR